MTLITPTIWGKIFEFVWKYKIPLAIALIILTAVIYHSCTKKGLEDEIRREREARSQEHQERIEESKTEVNSAANISNQAAENFNQSVNKDSSQFEAKQAEDRFCQRFKCDSSCEAWRRRNGVECN